MASLGNTSRHCSQKRHAGWCLLDAGLVAPPRPTSSTAGLLPALATTAEERVGARLMVGAARASAR